MADGWRTLQSIHDFLQTAPQNFLNNVLPTAAEPLTAGSTGEHQTLPPQSTQDLIQIICEPLTFGMDPVGTSGTLHHAAVKLMFLVALQTHSAEVPFAMEFATVRAEFQLMVPGRVRGLPRCHTTALTPNTQHTNP